ncbi:MAG: FAD-dependent oxidoreductase [Stackebrandtia sp.]
MIGLSIARALTERGISDVLILERALLASGGTGKSSGSVRAHYGAPSITKLSWNSVPTMEALRSDIGFRQVEGKQRLPALRLDRRRRDLARVVRG